MDLEDAGNAIFNELIWRSFFQDIEKDEDGNIISCKMHDLVHDLAIYIAGDEYFVEDAGSARRLTERTRHAFIQFETELLPSSTLESMRRSSPCLRSLVQFSYNHVTLESEFVFSEFILLRALDLRSCNIEVVPDCIGEMKHLRYLNLSNNPDITSLPKSTCLLRNMQTLSLTRCSELKSLPEHIENMRCLVHLDIEGCDGLTSMPIGIGQLSCLRTLCRFTVGKESGSGVDGLQTLNNLRGCLRIDGLDGAETLTEAKEANLMSKKNIHSLMLSWAWFSDLPSYLVSFFDSESRQQQRHHQNVIEGLQPHSNLRKLEVFGYGGVSLSPSWLTEASLLPNLVEISLSCCTCEHLGSLRKLRHLQILELYSMNSLKFIEEEEEEVLDDADDANAAGGGFPSLKELIMEGMPNLEGWSSSSWSWSQASAGGGGFLWQLEGLSLEEEPMRTLEVSSSLSQASTPAAAVFPCLKSAKQAAAGTPTPTPAAAAAVFPCLKRVTLKICPKLKGEVPLAWSPVQHVDIQGYRCNGMVLGSLRDLPSLAIDGFHELEYFPPGTLTNLTALHNLVISCCPNLKALPVELNSLSTLTVLEIRSCPNLVSLADEREGGLKNLSSLNTLVIHNCKALKRLPELNKASLVTLKITSCPEMEFSKEDFEHLAVRVFQRE